MVGTKAMAAPDDRIRCEYKRIFLTETMVSMAIFLSAKTSKPKF